MAITHVGSNSDIIDPAALSLTLTKPTGTSADDLLIIIFGQPEDEDGDISTPSGFTALLANSPVGGSPTSKPALSIFYKVAGSSEPADYTISLTNPVNTGGIGLISAYRGIETTSPIDAAINTATSSSSVNIDPPSITTITNGAWCICGGIKDNSSLTGLSLPSGYSAQTGTGARTNGNGGNGMAMVFAHKVISTAGAEDPAAFTWTSSADENMSYAFAIKPLSGGGGGSRRIFIT